MMTTMNLKDGTQMKKFLAQRKSMIKKKEKKEEKTTDKVTFLFFWL